VSLAEKMNYLTGADVSQQISTQVKESSGTGKYEV